MEAQQQGQSRGALVVCLLVLLLLMAVGWAILIVRVPILFTSQAFPGFLLDRDSGIATLTHSNQDLNHPWSEEIRFNLHSGTFDWKTSREVDDLFFATGTETNKNRKLLLRTNPNQMDGQFRLVSPSGAGLPDRNFQFPQPPYLVNERFVVGEETGNLLVLDCGDEDSVIQKTKVAGVPLVGGIRPIDDVSCFLRFQAIPIVGKNPPAYRVQHFRIDKDGVVKPGAVWQALDMGTAPYLCIANAGDERASINPTTYEVEFRDTSDGKLVGSTPFLDSLDPVGFPTRLVKDLLRVDPPQGPSRFLDLKRRKWLPAIEGVNYGPHADLADKFMILRGRADGYVVSKVFDIQKQEVISKFDSYVFSDFIDEDSILDVSAFSGITFKRIDPQTGDVLQTWKPLWWVIPLTTFLCGSWLLWSWLWLSVRCSGPRNGLAAVWFDVTLIALLPLIVCIVRLRFIGDITDLSRMPVEIAQAIILALLLVGVVWLMFTRMRIVLRLLPFLLAITVLAASVTITFKGQLAYVVPGAIQSLVPVSVFLVGCLVLRRMGYRLNSPSQIAATAGVEKTSVVTIRDMFVLMAVLAMLFAGFSPWLSGLGDLYGALSQVLMALWQFAFVSLAPLLAWWLAMSQNKWRFLGHTLFLGTFAFQVALSATRFAGSDSLIFDLFGFFPQISALPAMSFVATYWIACCFKFHGWEFNRKAVAGSQA